MAFVRKRMTKAGSVSTTRRQPLEVPVLWPCHLLTLRISAPNSIRRLGADQPDHERVKAGAFSVMALGVATRSEGEVVFHHACKLGLEGIVSKRLGSPYRSGRSRHWIKSKNPAAPGGQARSRRGMGQRPRSLNLSEVSWLRTE